MGQSQEGREECRLERLCVPRCCRDHLGLGKCSPHGNSQGCRFGRNARDWHIVGSWLETCWDRYRLGEKGEGKELRGNFCIGCTFETSRPMVLVVGGGEESQDQKKEEPPSGVGSRGERLAC